MDKFHLAQLNIAWMREPLESATMKGFVDNLDRINILAEQASGFVWRLQSDDGDATEYRPFGDAHLVNLSVWQDIASLRNFVYNGAHLEIMRQRKAWFFPMQEAYNVLWWIEAGHQPSLDEAKEKLERLHSQGPTPDAFTFKKSFPPRS